MDIIKELEWRGLVSDCTDRDGLGKRLDDGVVTLYCGFDPTANSLHVGSLVPLLALRRFQQFGHKPIVIAGGATGSIGDPSGKSAERQLLTHEQLKANIEGVKKQLASFLDFDSEANAALLVDNADWTAPLSFLDVLRDVGKHFKVNAMVAKESVRARMENRDVGISFTEFSYMILQALDFDHLYKQNECELQIGGSDQWGNITAGIDLIHRRQNRQAYGLTMPLITNSDGTKFGKTEAGAVALNISDRTALKDQAQIIWDAAHAHAPDAQLDGILVQPMVSGLAEVLVGYRRDPETGPVVVLGIGGVLAEIYGDATVRPAPVDTAMAREMINEVRGLAPIRGYRNMPKGDLDALAGAVAAVSRLAAIERPCILEAEINPLCVAKAGAGVLAVDALVRLTP